MFSPAVVTEGTEIDTRRSGPCSAMDASFEALSESELAAGSSGVDPSAVSTGFGVGVGVGAATGVTDRVVVAVGSGAGVTSGVAVAVGPGVGVASGVVVAAGVGVTTGVGTGTTRTSVRATAVLSLTSESVSPLLTLA